MADMKNKLRSLLDRHGLMTGADLKGRIEEEERQRAAGEWDVHHLIPGEDVGEEGDRFYLVQKDYSLDARHGDVVLGDVLNALPSHIALSACDDELEAFDPATAAFIDVETTGLTGGTGTVAFLVGVGYFTRDAFRLEQTFMRDYDEEEPMLHYLSELFGRFDSLVSYNGKSFDVPLLRTRFISNRIPYPLDAAMHFDLVHACRRFWKLRLQDCSLANIERNVLGLHRQGDIPSAEIPQTWFDYLESRDARRLQQVFLHHEMDVLSLVALTGHLSQVLEAPAGEGFDHNEDRLSLLRLCFRQRRLADVIALAEGLLDSEPDDALRQECMHLVGHAYKRMADWQNMAGVWQRIVQEFPHDLVARLELAKCWEHRLRDLAQAERICVETVQLLETRAGLGRGSDTESAHIEAFQYRLRRIQRKLGRTTRD